MKKVCISYWDVRVYEIYYRSNKTLYRNIKANNHKLIVVK